MAFVRSHLAQSRPANTNAASILTGIDQQVVVIQQIIVCNQTASAATYRIFLDNDGTTYSEVTALFYDVSQAANSSSIIELGFSVDSGLYLTSSSGNLAIRSGTANALTFTVNGGIFKN